MELLGNKDLLLSNNIVIMSDTKTTSQELSTNKYISFSLWNIYSIDAHTMTISKTDFSDIIDLQKFWTELSIDWYEHSVLSVHKVDFESDIVKKNLEKTHSVQSFSEDISIRRNKHNRAIVIRLAIDSDIVLVELM